MHRVVIVILSVIAQMPGAAAQVEYRSPSFGIRLAPLSQECADGNRNACILEAEKLYKAGKNGDAARHRHKACDLGLPANCGIAGMLYSLEPSSSPNQVVTTDLFTRSCTETVVTGCMNLGVQYANGTGVPKDLGMALIYLRRSCDAGFEAGCDRAQRLQASINARDTALSQSSSQAKPASRSPEAIRSQTPASAQGRPNAVPPTPILPSSPRSTAPSQNGQSSSNEDQAFENKLIATCNRVLGATTKLYETGGKKAVLEFESGSAQILKECQRRNIQIRPAAMDREIDAQLFELNARKQALQAQEKALDSAMCTKQNQILANVYRLDGIDGFVKEEAAMLRANPKCSQMGLHTRPPDLVEMARLCRVYNDLTAEGNRNNDKIRELEARAKAAQLKLPSNPTASRDRSSDASMRETCTKIGVTLIAERR